MKYHSAPDIAREHYQQFNLIKSVLITETFVVLVSMQVRKKKFCLAVPAGSHTIPIYLCADL